MAERKSTGFRFRLPWLLKPAMASPPATAQEPPQTTVQTSVASTSASRPPFRPPGRAPPPPTRTPPQSTSSPVSVESPPPPPPPVQARSPPKSPVAKTPDPVATRSTEETKTINGTVPTVETPGPATPPQRSPSFRPLSPPQPSSPAKSDSQPSSPAKSGSQPSSPAKSDSQPSSPAKPDSQPSSPSRTGTQLRDFSPPVSPSRMPTPPRAGSKPLSPSRLATQPHVATKPSSPSVTQSRPISPPTSPVHVQSPPSSPPPPAPVITTTAVHEVSTNTGAKPYWSTSEPDNIPEAKTSTEITHEKFPVDSYHVPPVADLATDATKSMNSHPMEPNSPNLKPKSITGSQVPLHREIKDDISKFIHKIATSCSKQSMDEKPGSVITLAGDNKGAFMHLGTDAKKREGAVDIKRSYKLDDTINGEGTSNDNKSQRDSEASENEETKAIVNSNIQGINNSIMFNSSVTERNPGVHLTFSRTLANTDSKIENTEPDMEMYKAEAEITPPETLVYDPTMERSFGGFFFEPTDSEPDDSEMSVVNEYEIEVL